MKVNFTIDPMYLTVFSIVRWIEKYHDSIRDKYTQKFRFIPQQFISIMDDVDIFSESFKPEDYFESFEYTKLSELSLISEIPNHRAKRFADFEYLTKYKLQLESYDPELAEKLINVYADKNNSSIVNFDDIDLIGETIWEYIHGTIEWKNLYTKFMSNGFGDTGMGVFSISLNEFVPCKFTEHKNAIYEMLRKFDEFKDMDDYDFYRIANNEITSTFEKELIAKMDDLVMNDFKLVGNTYHRISSYL